MERASFKPYLIVIGLMVGTALLLAFTVDVRLTDEAGINMILPDQVGTWQGQQLLYCLNPACQKEIELKDVKVPNVCPSCGGTLSTMSKAEKDMLPPDTELLRKRYVSPEGRVVFVSIVLSGKERSSIHRPQMCLVGQGQEITRSTVVPVPLADRKPLDVMSLELLRRAHAADGRMVEASSYYAYWFVGKGRETPYHVQRMIWMATDRIFHNVAHRWAYIAVSGSRQKDDTEAYQQELIAFVQGLYPHIVLNQG